MRSYAIRNRHLLLTALGVVAALLCGCSRPKPARPVRSLPKTSVADTVAAAPRSVDIAMLARSVQDALSMGERLDSASYGFTAILTDGRGRPLYADHSSAPGLWEVSVESPECVTIRNTSLGDVHAEDLRLYVASALGLTDADVVDAGVAENNSSTQAVVYRKGGLRVEMLMHPETDAQGTEHVWVSLTLMRHRR